jgi:hypothetical protein
MRVDVCASLAGGGAPSAVDIDDRLKPKSCAGAGANVKATMHNYPT